MKHLTSDLIDCGQDLQLEIDQFGYRDTAELVSQILMPLPIFEREIVVACLANTPERAKIEKTYL